MIQSMTGFARQQLAESWGQVVIEVRSVNHRYLELSFRMQDTFRPIEHELRTIARSFLQRGKVDISIALELNQGEQSIALNIPLAKQVLAAEQALVDEFGLASSVNTARLLSWPGIMVANEVDADEIQKAVKQAMPDLFKQLIAHRHKEGAELAELLRARAIEIAAHVETVNAVLPEVQQKYREKLEARFAEAKVELDPDRLEQEMLLLANKMDVAEELDRLQAHIKGLTDVLSSSEPVGRKLDFLMQEFNREANTLSSKAIDQRVTQAAVEMKVLIEQMREQVQNIQ